MKRSVIAAAWIAGATIPVVLATVFIVGCCVLPFHQVAHKLMPICDMAASLMRGGHAGGDHGSHHEPVPAQQKEEPVKRMVTEVPQPFRVAGVAGVPNVSRSIPVASYRSFITLGAVRCDQDVGLHVLVETFLI